MTATDEALLDRLLPPAPVGESGDRATRWLRAHGLPDARDESWLYTPLGEIISRLATASPAPARTVTRADVDRLAGHHGGARVVLINGVFVGELSDLDTASVGVRATAIPATGGEAIPAAVRVDGQADDFTDGFQALNLAASHDVIVVTCDDGAGGPADGPVHVVHVAVPGTGAEIAHPRTLVDVGDNGRLHLIETFTGLPGAMITNAATIIRIGPDAQLIHHRIQDEATGATHIGHAAISQGERSRYEATSVMLGADIARHACDVTLEGSDARVALSGLYRPVRQQRHDTAICVDHAASRGISTQQFKGVVDDHARGSFSGHVIVRPGTEGNDAQQSNPNLLLRPTAQADTRPWLEIHADEVACTHGATVGRLDDDALFYLRSRGIPHDEGRRMLIEAFVHEITDAIEPASLREHLATRVEAAQPGGPT